MNYFCCTDTRRNAVKLHPVLNGIDYLEVLDNAFDPYEERQTTLFVYFLKPIAPGSLSIENLQIEGGERIRHIQIVSMTIGPDAFFPASPPEDAANTLMIKVAQAGDFSSYTLRLVQPDGAGAPDGFDPVLSSVSFSFKVACPSDFDCKPTCDCIPGKSTHPQITYLAKDYASFRQLMLDRMSLLLPGWTERNAADMGIALVEVLAYVGDHLSYRQDAIATEAYLGTARRRTSVRRHARLVDYFMHEGCNARTWLHIQVGPNVSGLQLQQGTGAGRPKVLTRMQGMPAAFRPHAQALQKNTDNGAPVFELMHDITLYTAHNEIGFYTWGGKACCLPKGATKATLKGSFPYLKKGDVLIFTEVLGPETGVPQDADPAHRHVVRLTAVTPSFDLLYTDAPFSPPAGSPPVSSPPGSALQAVTEIEWSAADALPFALCISSLDGIENISVALGNNVLADHGATMQDSRESSLQPSIVPQSQMVYAKEQDSGCAGCGPIAPNAVLARYRPKLLQAPLTYAAPYGADSPATAAMQWPVQQALPAIVLHERGTEGVIKGNRDWKPQRDLLNSAPNAREFVVEEEWDGTAYIRFGNNQQGARPAAETSFMATYRIGNGSSGNVGAGTLGHIVTDDAAFLANMQEGAAVWNPLAAQGGQERESMEAVKQYAPSAFRTQQRAVTAADYETFAKKCSPDVQQTAATFRWTGSWKTVFLSADRLGGQEVDSAFEHYLRNCLEQYRMAGFDLEIESPVYVSLHLEMTVCVNPHFFAADVKKALLELFSSRLLAGNRKGIFHPDNFTFGQPVYLSPLYAAAQSVAGVDSVQITRFARQGRVDNEGLTAKKITLGRREIARLYNDRNFPERGIFNLIMKGGRS